MTGHRLPLRARLALLGAVVLVAATAVGLAAAGAVRNAPARDDQSRGGPHAAGTGPTLGELRRVPHLVFRSTAQDASYGRLSAVALDQPAGPRAVGEPSCERVDATAAGGLCLRADRGVLTRYTATVLDRDLRPGRSWRLAGAPSRTRLSGDGRRASTTVFVTGHSYAQGGFSTQTVVHDLEAGRPVGDLETFHVAVDGRELDAPDVNVWGVTFRPDDADRFLATVASGGRTWLVEGDLRSRRLNALREGVECPSLSPDGRRVAFKERVGGSAAAGWRVAVLDLASGRQWRVAEERSVDDQVVWLDDARLAYGLTREGTGSSDVWTVPVEGGVPTVLVPDAWSPAVVR